MTTKTQHKTRQLIIEFGKQGHTLGRAIAPEQVLELVEALRRRLDCTPKELDLSPGSLRRLEQRLIVLKQAVQTGKGVMDEEETMRLMRELTAYLGQVVAVNLGGEWSKKCPDLWPGMMIVPIPLETVKNGEIRASDDRGYPAANYAADFWDMIGTGGEKGVLERTYKWMTQRRWREPLK